MNLRLPKEFVLFDLEYTAWPGSSARKWSGPNEYREIIQIGAVRVRDLAETDFFCEFVRPKKNPSLSDFIIELTGITQKDVDEKGLAFPGALKKFLKFVGTTDAFCWGVDTEVLEENTGFHGSRQIFSREQFHDLRGQTAALWQSIGIDVKQYHSGTMIEAFGKKTERRAHDAVNDMRNLLDAIVELRKA